MKKKVLQLPKNYLSYSQIQLWLHDQARYKKLYFDNRAEFALSNDAMEYGHQVAEALEHERETGDLLTDAAMLLLPKYDIRDQEIRAELKTRDGWIPILGRPDMMDSASKSFYEIKTGKVAWTQNKANKHPQLSFYAMLIYLAYKVIPPRISLVWIETQDTEEGIKPTGRVQEYIVNINLHDILQTMALTSKVAKEIEAAWAIHEPDPKLEWGGPDENCPECGAWGGHTNLCVKTE